MTTESVDPSELNSLIADVVTQHATVAPENRITGLWATLDELGLTRVGIAEQHGGSGGTLDDLIVIVRALAENGAVTPLVESTTADWILAHAEHEPVGPCTVGCLPSPVRTEQLPGSVLEIPWARWASRALILGTESNGTAALVDLETADAAVTPGTDIADAQLDQVTLPAARPTEVQGTPVISQVRARMGLLRSATLVGAVRGAYQLTRDYVRNRHQFGKPLVKTPAVATALATIRTQVLQAEAALDLARERNEQQSDLAATASARVVCGAAATETAQRAHQLHGAMGITMEYPLHHLTRILWTARDADLPEQRWAELLGEATLAGGEQALWNDLTVPGGAPIAR